MASFQKKINNIIDLNKLKLRLRRYYRNETAYSITFKKWPPNLVKKAKTYSPYPAVVNDMVNIAITLNRHFGYDIEISLDLAISIHHTHNKDIKLYMWAWFDYGKPQQRIKRLTDKKAYNEQRLRGFIDINEVDMDKELPYIKSTLGPYIYPKQWAHKPLVNLCGIYDKLSLIGVSGYTGVVIPKKYK
jgi:hypothetical protein